MIEGRIEPKDYAHHPLCAQHEDATCPDEDCVEGQVWAGDELWYCTGGDECPFSGECQCDDIIESLKADAAGV